MRNFGCSVLSDPEVSPFGCAVVRRRLNAPFGARCYLTQTMIDGYANLI